jgi:hypothetical protein
MINNFHESCITQECLPLILDGIDFFFVYSKYEKIMNLNDPQIIEFLATIYITARYQSTERYSLTLNITKIFERVAIPRRMGKRNSKWYVRGLRLSRR